MLLACWSTSKCVLIPTCDTDVERLSNCLALDTAAKRIHKTDGEDHTESFTTIEVDSR